MLPSTSRHQSPTSSPSHVRPTMGVYTIRFHVDFVSPFTFFKATYKLRNIRRPTRWVPGILRDDDILFLDFYCNNKLAVRTVLRRDDYYLVGYMSGRHRVLWELRGKGLSRTRVLGSSEELAVGVEHTVIDGRLLSFPILKRAVEYLRDERDPGRYTNRVTESITTIILMMLESGRFSWVSNPIAHNAYYLHDSTIFHTLDYNDAVTIWHWGHLSDRARLANNEDLTQLDEEDLRGIQQRNIFDLLRGNIEHLTQMQLRTCRVCVRTDCLPNRNRRPIRLEYR